MINFCNIMSFNKISKVLLTIFSSVTCVILIIAAGIALEPVICSSLASNNFDVAYLPVVLNTWGFKNATREAWSIIERGSSVIDAVERGCSVCEREQCDGTVGYGGSPDENGETTLDALIMDGESHDVGAVAALRGIKDAISVAKHVLLYTDHTLLAGNQATEFGLRMGFKLENLTTPHSTAMHQSWLQNHCQPNFWRNVKPNPDLSCGPYHPVMLTKKAKESSATFDEQNHDTIGMIVIDKLGRMACGTSTNGARNKIPGRVGDSPIPGSGCYVDRKVGGAAATGDGDVMMRFSPSRMAVDWMERSVSPTEAAQKVLNKMVEYFPTFEGGIVTVNLKGEVGAACWGFKFFEYSFANTDTEGVVIKRISCPKA